MSEGPAKSAPARDPASPDLSRAATIGDLRRDKQRLHMYCRGCCHERELRLDVPPLDRLRDEQPVPTAGQRLRCTGCGQLGGIFTMPQIPEASTEARLRWGWSEEEIERARQEKEARS